MYNILQIPFKSTQNTKLRWFQTRINHRVLGTNKFLYRIRKSDNNLCTFCEGEEETIEYLLWECNDVQNLLNNFEEFVSETLHITFSFQKQNFILGMIAGKQTENLILLQIKYYIYTMRCINKQLSLHGLVSSVKNCILTNKEIACSKNNLEKFRNLWGSWLNMI